MIGNTEVDQINSNYNNFMSKSRKLEGFTLIEILVVVALIAILAAVTIVAINPAKNFADTRNATRSADVTQILNAATQYTSEEGHSVSGLGTIPACTDEEACIGTSEADPACVDLGDVLVDEYIVAIPEDPTTGDAADTGYTICQTAGGRLQIDAPGAENDAEITVMR
jgi:prepilin-type N-terminal cleavage/methylation domain-containing protein